MKEKRFFPLTGRGATARVAHVPVETQTKLPSAREMLKQKRLKQEDEVDVEGNPPQVGKILKIYRTGYMRVAVPGGVITLTASQVNKRAK